jgi:ABC-type bacteriocin/lantibiotic exporter with double-glycine peptidase domain
MHGIAASEQELAREAQTSEYAGTCEFAMAKILRLHGGPLGYRVRILCPAWEDLPGISMPFLTTESLGYWTDHWIVVKAVSPKTVVICDPMSRALQMSRTEFIERWRGVVVTMER